MGISIYRVTLTLTSPAIVGAKGSERGLLYRITRDIIYGATFHGTLVKMLALNVYRGSIIESQALQTFVTPLYPVTPGNDAKLRKLYNNVTVAHALSVCGKGAASSIVTSYNIGRVIELLEQGQGIEDAIAKAVEEFTKSFQEAVIRHGVGVSVNVADLKLAQGVAVEKVSSSGAEIWRKVKVRKDMYLENAVDRARGSVYAGALYGYEYIAPETVFTGYVACRDGQGLCDGLSKVSKAEILIGKGQGRGFGRARIEVEQVKPEEIVKVSCPIGEKLVALVSSSISFVADPMPRPVSVGDMLETLSGVKLMVKHVIGSRIDTYTGWSRLRHSPKLVIRGNAPGTIIIAELSETKLSEDACIELLMGMLKNSLPGFNTFHVVRRDPLYISPDTYISITKIYASV